MSTSFKSLAQSKNYTDRHATFAVIFIASSYGIDLLIALGVLR